MGDSGTQPAEKSAIDRACKDLLTSIKTLHHDESLTDFTIKCGTHQWKVHKAVISPQCDFFKTVCNGPYQETTDATVDLKEDDPQAVSAMIDFFYGCNFSGTSAGEGTNLSLCRSVYVLAQKYLLPGLEDLAAAKFSGEAQVCWAGPKFASAICDVYKHTADEDNALKRTLVTVAKSHAVTLFGNRAKYPDFHLAMRETPSFGVAAATEYFEKASSQQIVQWKWYKCPSSNCRIPGVFTFGLPANHQDDSTVICPDMCMQFKPGQLAKYEVKLEL